MHTEQIKIYVNIIAQKPKFCLINAFYDQLHSSLDGLSRSKSLISFSNNTERENRHSQRKLQWFGHSKVGIHKLNEA